jgi:hypothetical protein
MKILDAILYAPFRPMLHAINLRLTVLESCAAPCARCRSMVRLDRMNEDGGPQLMEYASGRNATPKLPRAIVCWYCEGAARRLGWKQVKLETKETEATQ